MSKISELPAADPLAGTELVAVVQGATTKKVTAAQVSSLGIIAVMQHVGSNSYQTLSTSFVDVDATNMKVAFDAPPSGKVLVRQEAPVDLFSGSAGTQVYWNLRDGSTNIPNTRHNVHRANAVFRGEIVSVESYITGLTPGNPYEFKWGWLVSAGEGRMFVDATNFGCALMVVTAAP